MNNSLHDIKALLHQTLLEDSEKLISIQAEDELLRWLTDYIDHLASNHFEDLLRLLYRIDVSEEKVRAMLKSSRGQNSSAIIASLIIERQKQKIYWRNKFKQNPVKNNKDDEAERW